MNALTDETRTKVVELNLPWLRNLRVSPGLFTVLNEEKPAHLSWPDFTITALLTTVLLARIVRLDLWGVYRLCVRIAGSPPHDGTVRPTPVGGPSGGRG